MMNRFEETFKNLKEKQEGALSVFLTAGYPDLSTTSKLIDTVIEAGADIIELGVPFSDPLADGKTIQESSYVALKNDVNLENCFSLVNNLRKSNKKTPIVLMGYYNPFLNYGISNLIKNSLENGVDGFIVPDLPIEEASPLLAACYAKNISYIPLIAPTSSKERIKSAVEVASGFIYCVSLTGVTGARQSVDSEVNSIVMNIRKFTDLPVLVGFGISTAKHVLKIKEFADGVVVGSAVVNILKEKEKDFKSIYTFVQSLKIELKGT